MINSPFSSGPSEIFDPLLHLKMNSLAGLVSGILSGAIASVVNRKLFRNKSFMYGMLTTIVTYVIFFVLVTIMVSSVSVYKAMGDKALSIEGIMYGFKLIIDPITIIYFIMWGAIILFTLFLLQVNDKFGPGILLKFVMGKYHKARKEQRIFMFLDMRSSTMVAEKLSNEKYFNLLRDLFTDITGTILNNEGEIYQYVGDEIIISWSIKKGIRNANCVRCFFEIQRKLVSLSTTYKQEYGLIPELKAGIHYGDVMAGEVGIIKKDIIYSGDVLNTTARIQEQCNQYSVDILISKETFDLISETDGYKLIPLGSIELRGKKRKIDLNTIRTI